MKRNGFSAQSCIVVALTALVGFGILLAGSWRWLGKSAGEQASRAQAALQGQAALEHLKQQGQYESLAAAMKSAQYDVHPSAGGSEEFYANNPAQQYQAGFSAEGVEVRAASAGGGGWRVGQAPSTPRSPTGNPTSSRFSALAWAAMRQTWMATSVPA